MEKYGKTFHRKRKLHVEEHINKGILKYLNRLEKETAKVLKVTWFCLSLRETVLFTCPLIFYIII